MPILNVLIKPASGRCNMRCGYCFYEDEGQNREIEDYGMMSEAVLETMIKKVFDFSCDGYYIAFQGGEPTLRGLPFFQKVAQLVEQYNGKKRPVTFAIQTNGLLLDDQWCQFFQENKFLVGLSMDGDKDAHDLNRVDPVGKGTFQRVLKSAKLLEKHGVEFNILTVVTAQTTRSIERIYKFFMKNGLCYQQYIPCLDPLGEERGLHPYSLKPEAYGKFLIRLFDLWYADRAANRFVYIRYFENLAGMMLGHQPESCGMMGICSYQLVVEADGGVYPCDFYVLDEYRLGSFVEHTVDQLIEVQQDIGFLQASLGGLEDCKTCPHYSLCRGGCRRDRQGVALSEVEKNYYCPAFKEFFAHATPKLAKLLGR